MKIILGSQSNGRKRILAEMGFEFECMPADIDEKSIRDDNAEDLTLKLANAKADAILPRMKEKAILITSDQVVRWNNEIREKRDNEGEAREFLKTLADYPVETVTAVVVVNTKTGERRSGVDIAKVYFKEISDKDVDKLIAEGKIFSWARAFCIDDPIIKKYVEKIEGERESIIGLPKKMSL